MDYKFGRKNNWRRWWWNAIKERLDVPTSSAVVLYLGGESDIDREVALSKGFAPHNLILIERDREIALRHRANGKLCLQGDFFDIVKAWPCSQTPHVIAGDFVGGLNKKMFEELISLTIMPSARNSVLAFNLLAGREGTGREIFVEWKAQRRDNPAITDRPHRGLMVWSEMASVCHEALSGLLEIRDGRLIGRKDVTEAELAEHARAFEVDKHRLVGFCRPESHQYVSESGQRFDSIVAIHPLRGANLPHWRDLDESSRVGARKAYPQALRGSINAVMAHRTMRLH